MSFESFDEAMDHLIDNGIQVVVGSLKGIINPAPILEKAAETAKADWFEFSHTEE